MKNSEKRFLEELVDKAKEQARIEHSSPLPYWIRPLVAIVGQHYWESLLVVSFVCSIPLSVLGFSFIYAKVMGL